MQQPSMPIRGRKTITAANTLERAHASLDSRSLVHLYWAMHWCQQRARLKPQAAVVIRRALELYARHLDALQDPTSELVAIESAGKGSGGAVQLTEARARLERAEFKALPLRECLYSPEQLREQQETAAAIEACLETLP
jgi:hypothetical protein